MFVQGKCIKNTVGGEYIEGGRFKRPDKSHLNSVGSSEVHSRSKYNCCNKGGGGGGGGGAHFVLLDCALI